MDNPEKLATYGTQDKRRRQTKQTIQRNWQHKVHMIKDVFKQNKQCCQRNWQHMVHKIKDEDMYKTNNPEKLATYGTQDKRRRQTKQTIQIMYPMLPVSLDCLFCLSSSYVPYVASFSGLFVLSVFVLCTICCQFPCIVHFWLPLRYSLTFI